MWYTDLLSSHRSTSKIAPPPLLLRRPSLANRLLFLSLAFPLSFLVSPAFPFCFYFSRFLSPARLSPFRSLYSIFYSTLLSSSSSRFCILFSLFFFSFFVLSLQYSILRLHFRHFGRRRGREVDKTYLRIPRSLFLRCTRECQKQFSHLPSWMYVHFQFDCPSDVVASRIIL